MKKIILKYLFSSIVVGLSGVAYHTLSQKPLFRRDASATMSKTQSERSAQRAARHAQLEQGLVADDVQIPVSFQLVHETVGHTPASKPVESVIAQVAVDKPTASLPSMASSSYSHAPYASDVAPSAQYTPTAHNDYYPEYYPMNYGTNHGSHVPASAHQTAPAASVEQPHTDLSGFAPQNIEKNNVEKDEGTPRFSRRYTDRSHRSPEQVVPSEDLDEEVSNSCDGSNGSSVRQVIPGLLTAAVAAAQLPWTKAWQIGAWAANKLKQIFGKSKAVVAEASSEDLGDGAFVPLWFKNSDHKASDGSAGGTPVLQITDNSAPSTMVSASTASTSSQSVSTTQQEGLWNYMKKLVTTPIGQVRLGLMLAQACVFGSMVRGAYQADQHALTDAAYNAALPCAKNLAPLQPQNALAVPAVQPGNKFAGLIQRAGIAIPCRPVLA